MTFAEVLVCVLSTMFIATTIRTTFGFGEALIAMPLLVIFVDLDVARALVAMVSVMTATSILINDWHHVRFESAWRLVLFSAIGIPIGFLVVSHVDETPIKVALALLILAFGIYRLTRPRMMKLSSDRWSFLFGIVSGVLGGVYNTAGPPIVVYASIRGWSPKDFRATVQGIFLPTSMLIVVGHGIEGRITKDVLIYFAACMPILAVSLLIGRSLNSRFGHGRFVWCVNWLLIVIGAWLLFDSFQA